MSDSSVDVFNEAHGKVREFDATFAKFSGDPGKPARIVLEVPRKLGGKLYDEFLGERLSVRFETKQTAILEHPAPGDDQLTIDADESGNIERIHEIAEQRKQQMREKHGCVASCEECAEHNPKPPCEQPSDAKIEPTPDKPSGKKQTAKK